MKYKHQKLTGDRDIRVLKLLPCGRSRQTPLTCELIATPLSHSETKSSLRLSYEALSYAWERQTPDRVVICQGKELLVTANCEAALYQLRHRTRSRLLLIDSICIDQNLSQEKSQQVQMMGDIYQQAQNVVVGLGEDSSDIARVLAPRFHIPQSRQPLFVPC